MGRSFLIIFKKDRHNQTVCDHACFNLARAAGGASEVVDETMQEQTRQALRDIETILKAAASSVDRVTKA
jgi:enamine deaminase RidA (YjgF/YER057c/UK114 family)